MVVLSDDVIGNDCVKNYYNNKFIIFQHTIYYNHFHHTQHNSINLNNFTKIFTKLKLQSPNNIITYFHLILLF